MSQIIILVLVLLMAQELTVISSTGFWAILLIYTLFKAVTLAINIAAEKN